MAEILLFSKTPHHAGLLHLTWRRGPLKAPIRGSQAVTTPTGMRLLLSARDPLPPSPFYLTFYFFFQQLPPPVTPSISPSPPGHPSPLHIPVSLLFVPGNVETNSRPALPPFIQAAVGSSNKALHRFQGHAQSLMHGVISPRHVVRTENLEQDLKANVCPCESV